MKKTFTTGELAKMCSVSIRTVQFYDKEGIVKPSDYSEGGKRLYTEKELKELHLVCLYKALGFSLEEIRNIINEKNSYQLLSEVLSKQSTNINEKIHSLQRTKEKLDAILQELNETGQIKVQSIEEVDFLLNKKKIHRKTDIMTYIFIACYFLLLIAGFRIALFVGGFAPSILITAAVVLLLGIIYYHHQVNAYICEYCSTKFTISFFRDMFSPNGWKKGKYLKCPECGRRGWFKETFPYKK
ncbi:MerR family transcriptional regulator [Geosporobacter ferrireducens]|uniref:HTH merR-type domain-containing protein n=1 Tax=Geosporobacter ferrireducens TaxID=1424294 RepID=A0A1D8GKQ5_9FIRM|nr:MerR family transcriptional regulator [Geosporobacter ferrireducens]AOT71496.1 hypothetical protein Gferi_19350 [Geosporobacter ferrireducens]